MSRRARAKIRDRERRRGRTALLALLALVLGGAALWDVMERARESVLATGWEAPALSVPASSPDDGPAEGDTPPAQRVRVEVLNAGGMAGAARSATDELRDQGFDVVYYGNAASFGRDTTVVLDRTAIPDAARRVARALGEVLGPVPVHSEPDTTLYVDITVLLGTDWQAALAGRRTP